MEFSTRVTAMLAGPMLVVTCCSSQHSEHPATDAGDGGVTGQDALVWFCQDFSDCDDGNPCTGGMCTAEGTCKYVPLVGGACDDGNACTDEDQCNTDGACMGSTVYCNDDNPCTLDQCDPENGCASSMLPEGTLCEDGDLCTSGETCQAGECKPGDSVTCKDPKEGDCATLACNPETGQCALENLPEGNPCQDGNACTENDTCSANGVCLAGDTVQCPDEVPCWNAWCNEQAKVGAAPCSGAWMDPGIGCNDDDACTTADACVEGGDGMICQGVPIDCGDGKPCEIGTCNADAGCIFESSPDGTACSLGVGPCFKDGTCLDGECLGALAMCDDGNPCTDDICDPDQPGECLHLDNTEPCNDGDPCTAADQCESGSCSGGETPCTEPCDSGECVPVEDGYSCEPAEDGTPCDDGKDVTAWDQCQLGVCMGYCETAGEPGAPCTEVSDECQSHCGSMTLCDGSLVCVEGICQVSGATVLQCPEHEDPCRQNVCDPALDECVEANAADGTECEDGFECTENDSCMDGACVGGQSVCQFDHAVIILPTTQAGTIEVTGECEMLVFPAGGVEPLPILVAGDVVISQDPDNPAFCKVVEATPQADGSLVVSAAKAALDEAMPFGDFGYEGTASPEVPGPGMGGGDDDFEWAEGKEVYMLIPKVTLQSTSYPVKLKLHDGHVSFHPWLTVKGHIDWLKLKWLMLELMGSLNYDIGVTVSVTAPIDTESLTIKQKIWPPQGTPEPTIYFQVGPVPCSASVSLEASLKVKAGAAVDASYEVTGNHQFKVGFFWNPVDKFDPYKWSPPAQIEKTFDLDAGVSGSVTIALKPKVKLKVATVVGPTFSIGPSLKGELSFDLIEYVLSGILKLCLSADVGGTLEVFTKTVFDVSIQLLDLCAQLGSFEKCFNACAPGADHCLNSGIAVICAADWDDDPCFDWKQVPCGADKECVNGVCEFTCAGKNCQQLGKQCDVWGDGCGGTVDCGPCEGGYHCEAGLCVKDCVPLNCTQLGKQCDVWPDTCGGQVACGDCAVGHSCAAGKCIQDCVPKSCGQLGKQCGWQDDGCGKQIDCGGCPGGKACNNGTCPGPCEGVVCGVCKKCDLNNGNCISDSEQDDGSCPGGYCANGNCVACPSNFCQDNNFGSGSHCQSGSTLVACATQGACKVVASAIDCDLLCENNACKGDPCGDGQCKDGEDCWDCPADCGGPCVPFYSESFNGYSCAKSNHCGPTADLSIDTSSLVVWCEIGGGHVTISATANCLLPPSAAVCGFFTIKNINHAGSAARMVVKGSFPAGVEFLFNALPNVGETVHLNSPATEVVLDIQGGVPNTAILHFGNIAKGQFFEVDSIEIFDL